MRLINYGVGELVDRLTILELKIAHGGGDHFTNERAAILVKLAPGDPARWIAFGLRLATVNGLLWHLEDDLRWWRREVRGIFDNLQDRSVYDVAEIAFRIQELNDQRAELIESINRAVGDHLGSEKVNG